MTAPGPLLSIEQYNQLAAGTGLAQARLDGIVQEIRDYCGWHIAPAVTATFTLDGSGATVQQLPTLRLNSVAKVTECGVELAAESYEWSSTGALRRRLPWTARYRGLIVEANHGYATVPANIVSVVLDAASAAISVEVGEDADQPETMGPFAFGARQGGVVLNAVQRRVLDRYRIAATP